MEQKETMSPQEAMEANAQAMNTILSEMKEIPILPSEVPKDVSALLKVEFPESGGVLTYMEGQKYPYKGFPLYEFVDKIDLIKKVSKSFLSGLYHSLKGENPLWYVTLIPAIWMFKVCIRVSVYVFYRQVERFRVKNNRYCDAVRELHFAMTLDRKQELNRIKELRLQLRDVICMLLEFDNAYRYRFQDLMEELDKKNLKKSPANEVIRLFKIMQSREKRQDVKDTWTLFSLFVKFYFFIDRDFKNILKDSLLEIDINKVKLSIEDQSYCRPRTDYNFGFILKEQQ